MNISIYYVGLIIGIFIGFFSCKALDHYVMEKINNAVHAKSEGDGK